jgi:cell division protein FtsB
VIAVGTGLFAVYLVVLTGQRALDAYRVRQELDGVRGEIASLRNRNLDLQAQLSSPRLDEEIERVARQELGLVRPGDQPVVLIWPSGSPTLGELSSRPVTGSPEPNWRQWLRLFFDVS